MLREGASGIVPKASYKYAFDLGVIVVAGMLLLPFWLLALTVIPVLIRLEDRGPVFYLQERLGLGGRVFRIIKFRTMKPDAVDSHLAVPGDERLTNVGRVLRKLHLDEIPQIANVLRGDMSLVGPRAETVERHRAIEEDLPTFGERLRVKPGIAGIAQVQGHYHSTPGEKLRYDNLYIATLNPWLDFKLLLAAVFTALKRTVESQAFGFAARRSRGFANGQAEVAFSPSSGNGAG